MSVLLFTHFSPFVCGAGKMLKNFIEKSVEMSMSCSPPTEIFGCKSGTQLNPLDRVYGEKKSFNLRRLIHHRVWSGKVDKLRRND